MGLDMYLTAQRFLSSYVDGDPSTKTTITSSFPELTEIGCEVNTVSAEIGYWRKANQIHFWFVENIQEGTDDQGRYWVPRDSLIELKQLCEEVISDPTRAEELLPTTSGFFFGSTEYDEYYIRDLTETIKIIDNCLALPDTWSFYYNSSW